MYTISKDFHELLKHRLTMWLLKKSKLVLNTYAGKSDYVVSVSKEHGIMFDLQYFNEKYLTKYYSDVKFYSNCESLIKGMANTVLETGIELGQRDVTITVTVKLNSRQVWKTYRIEGSKIYISL